MFRYKRMLWQFLLSTSSIRGITLCKHGCCRWWSGWYLLLQVSKDPFRMRFSAAVTLSSPENRWVCMSSAFSIYIYQANGNFCFSFFGNLGCWEPPWWWLLNEKSYSFNCRKNRKLSKFSDKIGHSQSNWGQFLHFLWLQIVEAKLNNPRRMSNETLEK